MLFNLSFFAYFGAIIPWKEFSTAHKNVAVWHLVVISILLLLFRRLPAVLALHRFIPVLKTWREAVFAGWFGPIGAGTLFFATIAMDDMDKSGYRGNGRTLLFPVVCFIVLSSVIVHGITVPVFQLSTSNLTRTLTNPAAIAHLVQRLPLIRPGQEIIIRRTDTTTEVTISRPASMYQQDIGDNDEITTSQITSDHQHASGNAATAIVKTHQSRRLPRQPSNLSQHTVATWHSVRSRGNFIEETHIFTHTKQNDGNTNHESLSVTEADVVDHNDSIEIITVRNSTDDAK
jgi:hypothetical protein